MATNKKQDVIIITTGGTIDKSFDEFDGSLENRESRIKQLILSRIRLPHTSLHIFPLMSKDSLNMTDYDRTLLSKTVQIQLEKEIPIIILHGTDTMTKSANFLLEQIPHSKSPVIFTGAMRPLGFRDSDAEQNITEALMSAHLVAGGIYLSFHNKLFSLPGTVTKNRQKKTFEEH